MKIHPDYVPIKFFSNFTVNSHYSASALFILYQLIFFKGEPRFGHSQFNKKLLNLLCKTRYSQTIHFTG